MATSYAHKFGQIIGDLLERAVEPHLAAFAVKHDLFLDKKGVRKSRSGKKLTWIDIRENKHDLDFVLEKGGTEEKLGVPAGFIEIAWRRYTKHSRNKSQEIQGAITPLLEKYAHASPFAGVVLAGEFTEGSITQLKSHGFAVLYLPYDSVVKAFATFGIDASFDEDTPEEAFKAKIEAFEQLEDNNGIARELMEINEKELKNFITAMEIHITRKIESIVIFPLYGNASIVTDVSAAIDFVNNYNEAAQSPEFRKYEIIMRYSSGSVINGVFMNKAEAIAFLQHHQQA